MSALPQAAAVPDPRALPVVGYPISGVIGGVAAAVAVHAIVSRSFDDRGRATGVGFVIGIGRIGSALAPLIAAVLFAAGFAPFGVSSAMGGLAISAALILSRVRVRVPESASR